DGERKENPSAWLSVFCLSAHRRLAPPAEDRRGTLRRREDGAVPDSKLVLRIRRQRVGDLAPALALAINGVIRAGVLLMRVIQHDGLQPLRRRSLQTNRALRHTIGKPYPVKASK